MNPTMYQNDFVTISQETLRDGTMFNLQLKRTPPADNMDNSNIGANKYNQWQFDYEEQELSNDLTGKTLEDEIFSFQQGTSIRAMGDDIRRLSISEYHRDDPMYYEYEFFNKDVMNGSSSRVGNLGGMGSSRSGSVFSDEDNEFDIDMDQESIFVNVGSKSVNDATQTVPHTTNSMALLLSGLDEDVSMNLDLDDENDGTGNSGVKKLFKLNKMFRNNNNRDLISDDEPQQIFKKKYFWSRKPTVPILRNSEPVSTSHGAGLPHAHAEHAPATVSSHNAEFDDDEMTDVETGNPSMAAAIVNPIKLLATGETKNDSDLITLSSHSTKINSLEPDLILSSNSSIMSAVKKNTTGSRSISSASSSLLSPPPMVQVKKAESLSLAKVISSKDSISTIIKKQQGVPKTRGRKPSPILDASKPFGCEYCDRRFKRQEHLKRHIRSLHICEKPYGCHLCGKKFSRSDNLSQHLKTHTHEDK
ncbi:Com2p [Kluyveromyces lactis]|uniref:KLLA0C17072p n=1 Tax=Kluyveromyces lactis (strain ATCC 8585 / CBS 2359 / DSM 70799 / NBRC 1267 / NRRL Y-1140 / WM37) TaxID=284590 RepID=Q6CSX6_KLULA|nr:uncharacterized protein KLLA0_C17072g [Kluyveromyces lactis]CAH01814.1 KLLA0C17072p [Kluyveromyces lactis]|eukprot:XP_452963.1 uncharacterized protein KLLA0_C17072g [Kluyveromyces lactis]